MPVRVDGQKPSSSPLLLSCVPGWPRRRSTKALTGVALSLGRPAPVDEKTLIYVAGFFDGEGNIIIRRIKNKRSPEHKVIVAVANTDLDILDFLKGCFGGKIHPRKSRSPKHNRCDIWVIQCQQAATFLKQILPYLRIKKRQAEIGVELERRLRAVNYRRAGLPQSEIGIRDQMWQEIKNLNQKKYSHGEGQPLGRHEMKSRQPSLFEHEASS